MKPPKRLSLLATQEELSEATEKWARYKNYITDYLRKESGLTETVDLLIFLAQNHHPKLRIKKKVGVKTKWSDYLNCAVAVEIDSLKKEGKNRKESIETLIVQPMWRKLVEGSRDPFGIFNKADKAARQSKHYRAVSDARKYAEVTNGLSEYEKDVKEAISDALKKN